MGYRDEFQAAIARADALEQQLVRISASSQASARELELLREQLAASHNEITRLRTLLPDDAGSHGFAPIRYALIAGAALVPATILAGSVRETLGISMSYLAVTPFAFALGAWLGARRSRTAAYVAGAVGVPVGILLLSAFYAGIWASL